MAKQSLSDSIISPKSANASSDSPLQRPAERTESWSAVANRSRWLYLASCCLLLLAVARFIHSDLFRFAYPVNDLTTPWVSSQAYLHGKNPYTDVQALQDIWSAADANLPAQYRDYGRILASRPMAYPPTTLAIIAPLGFFHWHTAAWLYLIVSTVCFVFGIILLARNLHLSWRDARVLYFVAFALAMAPLHMGSQIDNLSIVTIACLCACVGLISRRPYWSGILLALAVCLKPQVAILFFAYMWLRKKWKTAFTALAVCTIITVSSLSWMEIHHLDPIGSFLGALSRFSAPGGANSVFTAGVGRFQMLNLQVLVSQFTSNREWTGILAWAIFAILAGLSIFFIRSRVSDSNESAGIALISILTLLPTYQRFYTAALLLFVAYWAVDNWGSKATKAALVLLLPLLLAIAPWIAVYEGVPQPLSSTAAPLRVRIALVCWSFIRSHRSSFLLNGLLLPHVIWIELILIAILLSSSPHSNTLTPKND